MGRSRDDEKEFAQRAVKVQSNATYWEMMADCFQSAAQIEIIKERVSMMDWCIRAHRALKQGNRTPVIALRLYLSRENLHHL